MFHQAVSTGRSTLSQIRSRLFHSSPSSQRSCRRFGGTLAAVLALYCAAFSYGLLFPETRFTADSFEYIQSARNFLGEGIFYSGSLDQPIDPMLYSLRTPLYPFIISLSIYVTQSPIWVTLFQLLLTLLGAYFLWEILAFLNCKTSIASLVVTCYLLYPAQVIYTNLFMAEITLQFLLLASLYFCTRFCKTGNMGNLALMNVCLGLAALAKPIMMYFWIPNLLFHGFLFWRNRRKSILVLALLPACCVFLWSYRNYSLTDYFHFSSIKTYNMLRYNMRSLVRDSHRSSEANQIRKEFGKRLESASDLAESSRMIEAEFARTAFANWKSTAESYIEGTLTLFLDPGRFDIYQFLGLDSDVRAGDVFKSELTAIPALLLKIPIPILIHLILVGLLNLFIAAAFVYFLVKSSGRPEFKLYVVLVVLYMVAVAAPTGVSRFRLSFMPFLLVTTPLLGEYLYQRWKDLWKSGTRGNR